MALRLVLPAHHPERQGGAAALADHAGDDRMHRPLARRQLVRVARLERESRPPVLEQDAEFLRRDARAEAVEDRIDQRNRHPVAVDHGDIDRVLVHRLGQRGRGGHRLVRVDQRGQLRRRAGVKHMRQPGGVIGIAQETVARVIGQFRRFRLEMGALQPQRVHRRQVEMPQDVEQQQGRRALPVGRMLHHVQVAIAG